MENKGLFLVGDKYVELTNWEKLTHYRLPGSLVITPIAILVFSLFGVLPDLFDSFFISVLTFLLICGFLTYQLQKKRLKFKVVSTSLEKEEVFDIVEEVGAELEWDFISEENGVIKAQTRPSFFSGSWGERITIFTEGNKVFVNSICDPTRRSSMTSMGRNKKNEQTLLNKIQTIDGSNSLVFRKS